jgi:hypothetical protein
MRATRPDWGIAAGLLLLCLCLVQWQIGDRLDLVIDEGIYLEGAALVSQGQAPYRDFFTFTCPVTFWAYGAVFHAFGASLANARLVLSMEIAFTCAAIYWLLAALTETSFAAVAAALFAALCLDLPNSLYVTHRWDSNTWAMGALVLALSGLKKAGRWHWIASGACAAIATWTTPPFVVVAALLAGWIAWSAGWPRVRDYLVGAAAPSVLASSVLLYQGAFLKMIEQLRWATSHYTAPNQVPYGFLGGNPVANFQGAHGLASLLQLARLIEDLTPALLPPLAYLGLFVFLFWWRTALKQNPEIMVLLLVFSAGVLLAGLPRLGAHQLLFLSPVFLILCGYFLYNGVRPSWRRPLTAVLALLSCVLLSSSAIRNRRFVQLVETNAGEVRCTPEDATLILALQRKIPAGDSLFVFPYMPIVYFLAGGINPSRYSFLQPGMMADEDVAAVLAELRARPPRWMLWAQYPRSFWMANWPNTDAARLSFPSLESFMQANYDRVLRIELDGDQRLVLGCEKHDAACKLFQESP